MSTERPILFSGAMVRAILLGAKTQTRRVVKPQPHREISGFCELIPGEGVWKPAWSSSRESVRMLHSGESFAFNGTIRCPYGQPGDRLWVRETWASFEDDLDRARSMREDLMGAPDPIVYHATASDAPLKWRPSIYMPRWASRITLEVTGVRVERLQEISEEDAQAEGLELIPSYGWRGVDGNYGRPRYAFQSIWDSINSKTYPWESNPWVWVVEFRRAA